MSKRLVAAVVGAAILIGAFSAGATAGPTVAQKAAQALKLAKSADARSQRALKLAGQHGPTGATGTAGAAGFPGVQGPKGDKGATGDEDRPKWRQSASSMSPAANSRPTHNGRSFEAVRLLDLLTVRATASALPAVDLATVRIEGVDSFAAFQRLYYSGTSGAVEKVQIENCALGRRVRGGG